MGDKTTATWHGSEHECATCERPWGNADSARRCCGPWTELDDN